MYEVILVPLDGSSRAEVILPYVEGIATGRSSKVIFLQVVEPVAPIVTPGEIMPYYDSQVNDLIVKEANSYLAAKNDEFQKKGIASEAVVMHGPVVRTILEVAEKKDAGLIAMGSHGRSGLARVFYGSVASGVLHGADRPLLLVRSHGDSHSNSAANKG